MPRPTKLIGALTLAIAALLAPAADASQGVRIERAVDRSCIDRPLAEGPGVDSRVVTSRVLGQVQARLRNATGDWDLAIFDADTQAFVAGGAQASGDEVAGGIVFERERLLVQACRRTGADRTAQLSLAFANADPTPGPPPSMIRIKTPNEASEGLATSLGLDLTEHGRPGFIDAVSYGPADLAKLDSAGLDYTTIVPDLSVLDLANRRADAGFARRTSHSRLPSGRDTYRRLADYQNELKALAQANPKLVRHFELPFGTYEGRKVEGIEIANKVKRKNDGRPVFLLMGIHHAREWPSGEHTMEWAYELVNGFNSGKAPYRKLVNRTRTIIVPVVNPDGFNASREAGQVQGAGDGRGGNATQETANIVSHPMEYRRKNCRFLDDSESGNCVQPSVGLAEPGVDPNRNYGNFWGGPGASDDPTAQDYYGPGPFSEPESSNIRRLVSRRHVVTLITNHTFSNLVLRPPGLQSQGEPIDEPVLKALGDAMARENGYTSQPGYALYDTTGTTEDWSYNATGGLGYTFEIGPNNFHPPFAEMVAEYEGTTQAAGNGGGNRAAFLIAQRNTVNTKRHSVLRGRAPKNSTLRLTKTFETPTSQDTTFTDKLFTALKVGGNGRFVWHINPSTRPLVAKDKGRTKKGDPSPPQAFSGSPGPSATPCADADSEDETCSNDHAFTVPQGGGVDNAKATVRIDWPAPTSDWDMKVFRDSNGDGSSVGETEIVGASAQGTTNFETTTISEPILTPGGKFVARVTNYAAGEPYDGTITFGGPDPLVKAKRERWTLTCLRGKKPKATRQLYIKRGQRKSIDLRKACKS